MLLNNQLTLEEREKEKIKKRGQMQQQKPQWSKINGTQQKPLPRGSLWHRKTLQEARKSPQSPNLTKQIGKCW